MKITRLLRQVIKKEGVTIYRIAKAIGVDRGSLYRALRDEGNPEGRTIEKILTYLGYEIKLVKSTKQVENVSKKGRSRGR